MGHYDSCYEAEERATENQANAYWRASQVFVRQAVEVQRELDEISLKYKKDAALLLEKLEKLKWAQQEVCPHLHRYLLDESLCRECGAKIVEAQKGE